MAPKAHRAGATGLPRTHSRSSSGGSSKAALNLHFTQKDPVPPKQPERTKKAAYVHESHSRNTSPHPRLNSAARVASREHLHAHRYSLPPAQRQQGAKAKCGFTLASPPADDDDEWVSSESGVATPNTVDSDSGQTPVNQPKLVPTVPLADEPTRPDTPRAQPQSLSRVPTIRAPETPVDTSSAVSAARAPQTSPALATPLTSQSEQAPQTQLLSTGPCIMETRSATTSPTHRTHHPSHKRLSLSRPPSMHSAHSRSDVPLRPHPLIRVQSFGHGIPISPKVVPLSPLTVTSEASVSSPILEHTEKLSTSPSSVKTTYAQPSSNRRTSVSSVRSVATLPSQPQIQAHFLGGHDRHRTLSSISSNSSSSVQALASLAHLPTTRPSTPQYTAYFPPASIAASLEVVHPLLPPPYLSAHMSILTHRSPLKESYDRVTVAREQQKREGRGAL